MPPVGSVHGSYNPVAKSACQKNGMCNGLRLEGFRVKCPGSWDRHVYRGHQRHSTRKSIFRFVEGSTEAFGFRVWG